MSIYSNIDLETFEWVKGEVEVTLESAKQELQEYVTSDKKEDLLGLNNHLHQVLGSLQMLEMKSLSALVLESERLVEDFSDEGCSIGKSSFVVLVESAFSALKATFERIENGLPENPTDVVELINQMRAVRGQDQIEISSLFSPMIDVFPEVDSTKALKDKVYIARAHALRTHYQAFLLQWLRDDDNGAVEKMGLVFKKLLQMSTFGSVARLWWVATAYVDFVTNNDLGNKSVHSRIFRQIDDRFRYLELHGESALVTDPGEELVKLMLFYIGVGEVRTERMDEIVDAFALQEYFPALKLATDTIDFAALQERLVQWREKPELPLSLIRQLVTNYFEDEQTDNAQLDEIVGQFTTLKQAAELNDAGLITDVVGKLLDSFSGIRKGIVERNDDVAFHLASAFMFVVNEPQQVGQNWLQNGELKLQALAAINNQQELSTDMDGSHLTGSERKALLDVVGTEVEENLKDIESNLEKFSAAPQERELLSGIDQKIRQVRGALQVLGEQKVGLLLKMAEEQFIGIENGNTESSPALIEALAIAVGTMEEYVKGLQAGRTGMDYLLDRSITDLEVAIGKKVSRDDVEDLLDKSSDSLFTWLGNQSDFALFTNLKSTLRDLNILAKKTKLTEVEALVKEQDRLIDVISQEPAFLTDNITNNLQNNMAGITEQIITLYGTEDTAEELQSDEELAYKKSAIEIDEDDESQRFHDDMELEGLDDDIVEAVEAGDTGPSSTEIGKKNAVEENEAPLVDDAIFEIFIEESVEVLEEANIQHKACTNDPNDRTAIRELRRAFHTLKGSARMVGLNDAGEVAWFSESLFNYVLDTEKPLTPSILAFSREALDEFEKQVGERYENQHLLDTQAWGEKTEKLLREDDGCSK